MRNRRTFQQTYQSISTPRAYGRNQNNTLQAADIAGLKAIFVQAKDNDAKQFYERHGFIRSPHDPLQLFFPLDALRQ